MKMNQCLPIGFSAIYRNNKKKTVLDKNRIVVHNLDKKDTSMFTVVVVNS